jgi:hypothetical protein
MYDEALEAQIPAALYIVLSSAFARCVHEDKCMINPETGSVIK